jgi:sigma-B regulation protein RsbQ
MATNYLAWANGFAPIMMGNPEKPELGQEFARSLGDMRPDIAQSTARVIFESDFRTSVPSIRHPVLVLQSMKDNAVPVSVGHYLVDHIAGSQMALLSGEGHLPHLSAPEDVISAIRAYIADIPA